MVKANQLREAALDKTLMEIQNIDEVGDNTDRLSDISEHDDDLLLHQHTGWINIRSLMQKKDVRIVSTINLVLFVLNLVVFVLLVGFATYASLEHAYVNELKKNDTPCLYIWTEWSACSATCRSASGQFPIMTRTIRPESVIQARGKYFNIAPCPPDVIRIVDSAPCNVLDCPRSLSTFNLTSGFVGNDEMAYNMRDLPIGSSLIEIDTEQLYEQQ